MKPEKQKTDFDKIVTGIAKRIQERNTEILKEINSMPTEQKQKALRKFERCNLYKDK